MTLTVLTQPMVDVLVRCDTDLLEQLGLPAGSHAFVNEQELLNLLTITQHLSPRMMSGGSGANSVACARVLGTPAICLGLAANDPQGRMFLKDLTDIGVEVPAPLATSGYTGTCISFITPHPEKGFQRTMRTHLGVGTTFTYSPLIATCIARSTWLLLEGYYLSAGAENRAAFWGALQDAKQKAVAVAFCVAADSVATRCREEILQEVLPRVSMVYANDLEAMQLTHTSSSVEACQYLTERVPTCVVTCGPAGAWISQQGESVLVPAFTTGISVVDTTGAGDAYIGALLAGIMQGHTMVTAARGAARIAAEVVSQEGARLQVTSAAPWRASLR